MPEGDTVRRAADRLGQALTGRRLTLVDIRWGTVGEDPIRDALVEEIVPRGKHLLHRFDTGWTLHTHLRMEGSWRIEGGGSPAAARALRRRDLRVALGTAEWTTLGLRLGEVDLVRRRDEHRLVGHLGPDVLGADWDAATAVARLAGAPGTTVAAALLDQRNLAGVGTFWASEALFLQRLDPWRPVAELREEDLAALVERVHALMVRSHVLGVQSSTGQRRADRRGFVHGRARHPCRRCGTTIQVAPLDVGTNERVFFSCPVCQGG
ncbi:Fpg/Nei family DNA glycosylase [Janibacter cremeus]|uniref:DNA-formamidopyrimidine glycosylase family protein n=1 Tax=Janibacter cremeus TaxID=1285192 RepID=UPI0023F7AF82|nr:DNA-formamidopyrimidine glycosylase family protein [Janibacter cremeus]WEV79446.1 Fpg/Nei family DNA glycosylase [Janibacter cremeus]